jgi:hypothetical protein
MALAMAFYMQSLPDPILGLPHSLSLVFDVTLFLLVLAGVQYLLLYSLQFLLVVYLIVLQLGPVALALALVHTCVLVQLIVV